MYKKNSIKYAITVVLLIVLVCGILYYFSSKQTVLSIKNNEITLTYNYDGKSNTVRGQTIEADDNIHIFVPPFYKLDNIIIDSKDNYTITKGYYYKDSFSTKIVNKDQVSPAILISNNKDSNIIIHQLENDILSIDLKDGYTLDDIKADKELKVKANIQNIDKYGKTLFNGKLEHIKGRGNSSWTTDKRSYLISFKSKTNIMNIGDYSKYCLIPSYCDMTGIRNKLVFNYANRIGMDNANKIEYINLFVNGNYEGLYTITNHVSNNTPSNVNTLSDKKITIINDNIGDLKQIKYFDNKQDSKTQTYIIEKDDSRYYLSDEESAGFITKMNDCYRIHNSKGMTFEEVYLIASTMQKLENAIYDDSNDDFINMIDIDSWVKRYLIEELFQNSDTDITSFFYTIKRNGSNIVYAGPIWDYDNTMGEGRTQCQEPKTLNLAYLDGGHLISKLSTRRVFMDKVINYYNQELYPNLNELIYSDTTKLSNKIKSDMYLNALRYNQQNSIVSNNRFYQYDYKYGLEMLQGNLYEHSKYMFDVYQDYYNYVKIIFRTKNYIMHDVCFLVKNGHSFIQDHEIPYYSNGYGFVWNKPLWISKWVDSDGKEFDFTKPITEDMELYAVWEGDTNAGCLKK